MNEMAISIVMDYLETDLAIRQGLWPAEEFEELSCSRWAAYEILNLLMDHPEKQPMNVIENFYMKMLIFSKFTKSLKQGTLFSCAAETANQILLLFV